MTPIERRATLILAAILVLRMTALFMVLPVLAPWALSLAGQPGVAVGLAVGGYGLTQALLQIPFGWLSDRVGRKPVMLFGLAVFALGSLVAARAQDIDTLLMARLLQGGGAIAAASTALLSDLTRESVRTTAMAIIGASIGGAFLLALIVGPALLSVTAVPGLFDIAAVGALLAMVLVLLLPPAPPIKPAAEQASPSVLRADLLQLDGGVFALHAMLASLFVGLPLMLQQEWGWPPATHWKVYLPVMLASLLPVFPLIRYLERRGRIVAAIPVAVMVLTLACVLIGEQWLWLPLTLWMFFCAFNLLEASLPSLVSRRAPAASRGRAMGVFSSAQFLGAFCGAALGGLVLKYAGPSVVILSAACWGCLWLGLLAVRIMGANPLSTVRDEPAVQTAGGDPQRSQSKECE
ncbi:major facilitator family transporter [Oceanococcus atlanticus]|uniref:Major facilitator family transporter n=1 Tax=Oceanococcus atlanticus TaxID=1317117 RepID=A0A1Y1SE76_9GAMM|nr:MFS transporter [Oceanococcus atlanticus]ORE87307.1 major facilitator family transporter [Oceanococcus atlanticus]